MKKTANPKPTDKRRTMAPSLQTKNDERENRTKPTQSNKSLYGSPLRKASTPTHEQTTRSISPDISCILSSEGTSDKQRNARRPGSKTVAKKDPSLEYALDFEYTRYLHTVFKKKLAEAESSEIDINLQNLQKRIAENQNILQKTSDRLKNISFNKEVEILHSLHNPNYGRVLETLDSANCEESFKTLNKKLEERQNQLQVKNIELPEGGGAQLLEVINETLATCEKLKANHILEIPNVLSEIKAANQRTSESISRCLEKLPEVEDLELKRAVYEISVRDNS